MIIIIYFNKLVWFLRIFSEFSAKSINVDFSFMQSAERRSPYCPSAQRKMPQASSPFLITIFLPTPLECHHDKAPMLKPAPTINISSNTISPTVIHSYRSFMGPPKRCSAYITFYGRKIGHCFHHFYSIGKKQTKIAQWENSICCRWMNK